jgi:hypothetical protein
VIPQALHRSRGKPGLGKTRQRQPNQQRHDRYDYQELDQREGAARWTVNFDGPLEVHDTWFERNDRLVNRVMACRDV